MPSFLVRTAVLLAALPTFLAIHGDTSVASAPRPRPAATVTLSGRITDGATRGPIAEVQVALVGRATGTLSRADGSYAISLPDAAAGSEVTLRFERIGRQGRDIEPESFHGISIGDWKLISKRAGTPVRTGGPQSAMITNMRHSEDLRQPTPAAEKEAARESAAPRDCAALQSSASEQIAAAT